MSPDEAPTPVPGWESVYQGVMNRQATAARAVSGAEASGWNGGITEITGGPLSTAHFDGRLEYDQAFVTGPMRHLAAYAGQQHSPETLTAHRNALQTMLHENSHLMVPAAERYADSASAYTVKHNQALEEGVSEVWSSDHVNDYIDALGVEEKAPGIKAAGNREPHPQYAPATRALADGLGRDTGLGGDEVLRRLNNESAGGKWPAAAAMAFEAGGLADRVPAAEQGAAKLRIQVSMQSEFTALPDLAGNSEQLRIASLAAGHSAVRNGRAEVAGLQQQYGVTPAAGTGVETGRSVGQGQAVPSDLQQAMALNQAGSTPMGSTRQLGSEQFGGRRESPQGGQQAPRTGPERGD